MAEAATNVELTEEALAGECVRICEERKALDIRLYNVQGTSMITDYYLICSGNSEPHIQGIAANLDKELAGFGLRPAHIDGAASSRWIVMDYGTVLIHIFHPSVRTFYEIEAFLGDEKLVYSSHQDDTSL